MAIVDSNILERWRDHYVEYLGDLGVVGCELVENNCTNGKKKKMVWTKNVGKICPRAFEVLCGHM